MATKTKRNLLWALVVVVAALFQTTWLDVIRVAGVLPNLPLLLVAYFAITEGEERAMFTGALGGAFQDVASNVTLGHNVLAYVIVGYALGRLTTRLITEHPAVKVVLVFLGCVLQGLIYTTVAYVQEPQLAAVHDILSRVVPGAFYSALVTPLLFVLLDRPFRREIPLQGGAQ